MRPIAGGEPAAQSGSLRIELDVGDLVSVVVIDHARILTLVAERMIRANGVELCTEPFGDPADPAVLLVMGMGASMIWWEEEFCRRLADGGRFVIRYDHRDTGRSVAYEPGSPPYSSADLVGDAAGVLDAYAVSSAHVIGLSMGGALAQLLALDFADRVASLVLISTSPAGPVARDLPPMSDEYARFIENSAVDWSDADSVIDYVVADWRALAGPRRPFDEARVRELATRDLERARDFATGQNHAAVEGEEPRWQGLPAIRAPTLVLHGTVDPLFDLAHGEALADEIPDARLVTLEGSGHGLDPADWDSVVSAILDHTAVTA
jgi:pimeloyl-ACP methyl ester carboxylesterase